MGGRKAADGCGKGNGSGKEKAGGGIMRWETGWQAVPAGCAWGMEPEGAIVTGREPSIPARSPRVPLAPETIER